MDSISSASFDAARCPEAVRALLYIVANEIQSLPLVYAARTHGSMLMLKFGKLSEAPSWAGRKVPRPSGDWELLIKLADWNLSGCKSASNASDAQQIDEAIIEGVGLQVSEFTITPDGIISIQLGSSVKYEVLPLGPSGYSLWSLYRSASWALTLEAPGIFEFEISES